jgi:hypothetical protein
MNRQEAENEDGLAYYFDNEEDALVFIDYGRRLLTSSIVFCGERRRRTNRG